MQKGDLIIFYTICIHVGSDNFKQGKYKIERFTAQLYNRIREGEGKVIYLIDVTDFGQLFIIFDNIKLLYNSIIQLEFKILNSNCIILKKNIFTYNNYVYYIYTIEQLQFVSL